MGDRDGEMIQMVWDGDPDWWALRGHSITREAAFDEVRDAEGWEDGRRLVMKRAWARWSYAGQDGYGETTRTLAIYTEAASGRFPITLVEDVEALERLQGLRERRARLAHAAREAVATRWPDATIEAICVPPHPHPARVVMRIPGLIGTVSWDHGSKCVLVQRRDLQAWQARASGGCGRATVWKVDE